jgi:hypothetical protein
MPRLGSGQSERKPSAFADGAFLSVPICPHCGSVESDVPVDGRPGCYRCWTCTEQLSVAVGTPKRGSHLPLRVWYLLASSKGIGSVKLAEHLGIGQQTAWFLGHRPHAMLSAGRKLSRCGIVEADGVCLECGTLGPKLLSSVRTWRGDYCRTDHHCDVTAATLALARVVRQASPEPAVGTWRKRGAGIRGGGRPSDRCSHGRPPANVGVAHQSSMSISALLPLVLEARRREPAGGNDEQHQASGAGPAPSAEMFHQQLSNPQ